jgi:murein DD-endopeptidase MepM/ murein hydrolase activator NlpD
MSDLPLAHSLAWPITPYEVGGYRFGQRVRSRWILWARHLGDDILADPGTPVAAIGTGKVMYADVRPGSAKKRNWGGLVVLGHQHPLTKHRFFSVYGHITDLKVRLDEQVSSSQIIGTIAPGLSAENGWWKLPHLHFAIYAGPWREGEILPGYKRPFDGRTKFSLWRNPQEFIRGYERAD